MNLSDENLLSVRPFCTIRRSQMKQRNRALITFSPQFPANPFSNASTSLTRRFYQTALCVHLSYSCATVTHGDFLNRMCGVRARSAQNRRAELASLNYRLLRTIKDALRLCHFANNYDAQYLVDCSERNISFFLEVSHY